jgi:hypothetical protein
MYHVTPKSKNQKVGDILVTTSTALTCSDNCPWKCNGCYAEQGPLAIHFRAVTAGKRGGTWDEMCQKIASQPPGSKWRHNQAGDLAGEGDVIDTAMLRQLVAANMGKRGWTYTHKPVLSGPHAESNKAAIAEANRLGFTINLSADSLADADAKADLMCGPVAVVLPSGTANTTYTPKGRKVVVCPAQRRDLEIACKDCMLCQQQRFVIVGFIPHGSGSKKVDATIAKQK